MNISAIGKALDQPLLISKLKDQTPKILCGAAFAYGLYDTMKAPKEERKNRGLKKRSNFKYCCWDLSFECIWFKNSAAMAKWAENSSSKGL